MACDLLQGIYALGKKGDLTISDFQGALVFGFRSEQLELIYRWEKSWLFAVYYYVFAVKLS